MKNIVVRCNTGIQTGMGHLVRCANLMSVFDEYTIHFLIKTDNKHLTTEIIKRYSSNWTFDYMDSNLSNKDDLKLLIYNIKARNAFLILDHYQVDEEYQKQLRKEGVHWLQFDSHAQQNLYANIVLHSSPGATHELYSSLIDKEKTKALLGVKYIILNEQYRKLSATAQARTSLKSIIICFGAGNDNKLIIECLENIDKDLLSLFSWNVVIGQHTQEKEKIRNLSTTFPSIQLIENEYDLSYYQLNSDLLITSPGTLSYEAAALGLPMLLLKTNDSQSVNLKGWQEMKVALNIGKEHKIDKIILNQYLRKLSKEKNSLKGMSEILLNTIDNQGVFRVKKEILSEL